MPRWVKCAMLVGTAVPLGLADVAGAQTAPVAGNRSTQTPPPDAVAANEPDGIDPSDIVVTAQRRTERLQDVPISVAVVSGDTLTSRGAQTFEQLAPLVPNLTIVRGPAASTIALRGIGSADGSPSLDQSVVMFVDGIYGGNARQFSAPFLDIERVEVLRGPQGALVGRNTSAGAINVITRKPGHVFAGYANADYNFDFHAPSVEGGVDIPVTDSFAIRAVGRYAKDNGFVVNTLANRTEPRRRDIVGRITGLLETGPATITAKYEHLDINGLGNAFQPIAPTVGQFLDDEMQKSVPGSSEYDNQISNNAVVQIDLDLGGLTLTSISGYSAFTQAQRIDADFFASALATSDFDQKLEQASQEVRLVSPSGRKVEYLVGAYYSSASLLEQRTTGVFFAPPSSTYRIFDQENEVISAYGALSVRLAKLKLNGSLRWTHESKDALYKRFQGADTIVNRVGTQVAQISDRISAGQIDPAASAQYEFSRNAMVYVSYSRGSKSGGFQGAVSNATQAAFRFRPEKSEAFEAGTKLTFPGLGYLNISAFHVTYTDLQVTSAQPTAGGLSAPFFTGNADEARIIGAESEFLLRVAKGFQIQGSLGWLPTAKYINFTNGPCYVGQVQNGSAIGSCNQTGKSLGFAPKYTAAITALATVPVSNDLGLEFSLSPLLQGDSQRDYAGDPVHFQRSFFKLDGRIAVKSGAGWEVAVLGRNLTNKRTEQIGASGGLAQTFLSPTARAGVISPPRNIAVQGRLTF